jgi:hypothetical protein
MRGLDTGVASLIERWHLLHPFIQLDNNTTCAGLPVATLSRSMVFFSADRCIGVDRKSLLMLRVLALEKSKVFRLAFLGTRFLPGWT